MKTAIQIFFTGEEGGTLSEIEFNCIKYYTALRSYIALCTVSYQGTKDIETINMLLEDADKHVCEYNKLILKYIELYSLERLGRRE